MVSGPDHHHIEIDPRGLADMPDGNQRLAGYEFAFELELAFEFAPVIWLHSLDSLHGRSHIVCEFHMGATLTRADEVSACPAGQHEQVVRPKRI